MDVHAVDLRGEKCRLIPAGTAADLHDNILVIVRVLGEQKDLQLLFQLLHPLFRLVQLFLCQLAHLLV